MLPQRTPSPPPTRSHPLPPDHFLALPPTYAQQLPLPAEASGSAPPDNHGAAPDTASLASADFEVDVRTGFLPATKNVERLPIEYAIWEDALDAARGKLPGEGLRLGGQSAREQIWRRGIEAMPVLDTTALRASFPVLRRAHLVLAFLLHFYAHSEPSPTDRTDPLSIPPSISVPLLAISPVLGLPPILTYADTVLYNFLPALPTADTALPLNPPTSALASFTNTKSEEQFYVISALCEIAGAEALKLMRQSLDELFLADAVAIRRLTAYLKRLAVQIDRIGDITLSIMQGVDPEEFYHLIRPWFKGGDSDGPGSLGWMYAGVDDVVIGPAAEYRASTTGPARGRLFSGPSAGQSSLIHAIDIFLTVDHTEREGTETGGGPAPGPTGLPLNHSPVHAVELKSKSSTNEGTFVQRMLQYMPLAHRTFLLHLSTHPTPLRPLVVACADTHPKLAEAYDAALAALKRFREKHMRIVSLYIVQQARRPPSARIQRMLGREEEVVDPVAVEALVGELRGTGGSPLFKFLKRCRDNTLNAMVTGKMGGSSFELA